MMSFCQFLKEEGEPWALPDYPEQVMAKDDPKGDWVTGDPPKAIDFPDVSGKVKGIENTTKVLQDISKVIEKERKAMKKG